MSTTALKVKQAECLDWKCLKLCLLRERFFSAKGVYGRQGARRFPGALLLLCAVAPHPLHPHGNGGVRGGSSGWTMVRKRAHISRGWRVERWGARSSSHDSTALVRPLLHPTTKPPIFLMPSFDEPARKQLGYSRGNLRPSTLEPSPPNKPNPTKTISSLAQGGISYIGMEDLFFVSV